MKERALMALSPPGTTSIRYQPSDRVMQFLQTL
jgi:hypothetical protein